MNSRRAWCCVQTPLSNDCYFLLMHIVEKRDTWQIEYSWGTTNILLTAFPLIVLLLVIILGYSRMKYLRLKTIKSLIRFDFPNSRCNTWGDFHLASYEHDFARKSGQFRTKFRRHVNFNNIDDNDTDNSLRVVRRLAINCRLSNDKAWTINIDPRCKK